MIRVGFTFIGGKNWTGGYNYLLNLVRALSEHAYERVQPVLFLGTDISERKRAPLSASVESRLFVVLYSTRLTKASVCDRRC